MDLVRIELPASKLAHSDFELLKNGTNSDFFNDEV